MKTITVRLKETSMDRSLNPDWVKCRADRHAMDEDWTPYPYNVEVDTGFTHVTRCLRCGTIRLQVCTWDGQALHTEYHHPDGYRSVTGLSPGEAKVWLERTRAARQRRLVKARSAV